MNHELQMPNYWILKTEPSTYSFDDLVREKRTVWDGVKNAVALRNIGRMKPGDPVMIYHTGDEKSVVGLAEVASNPYADPKSSDPGLLVVELIAGKPLRRPVTLAAIKGEKAFADLALVRMGRLSVVSATKEQWDRLLEMSRA
jgi:predicted RNA-binding protein with PUA-like domain